jgi:tetratricopeptide (TPR) repeat protein
VEWARQLALSEQYDAAVTVYDRLLLGRPGDLVLRKERARALSWKGDARRAADAYAEILDGHPDDTEARVMYARNLVWLGQEGRARRALRPLAAETQLPEAQLLLGELAARDDRPRRAILVYDELIASLPRGVSRDLPDRAVVELARAVYWTGDARGALHVLDTYDSHFEPGVGTRHLREEIIADETGPWAETGFSRSMDSDDLEIRIVEALAGWAPSVDGGFGGSFRAERFDQGGDRLEITRVGALARWRAGDVAARAHFRLGEVDELPFEPVTGSAYVDWTPLDALGFGVSYERTDYESFRAQEREIIGRFYSGAVRVRPVPRVEAVLGGGTGIVDGRGFGPENRREHGVADVRYRLLRRPRLLLSAGMYAFRFSERADDGYYNPEDFISWTAGFDFNPVFETVRSELVVAAGVSAQRETPGGASNAGNLTVRAIFHPWKGGSIEYRYDTSDSKMASDLGFSRTRHGVWLRASF